MNHIKMNIFKNAVFSFIIVLIASCSNISYNTPFINSDEMIQLEFGLTKKEVLKKLGNPLYVGKGDGSTKTSYWIYEVRTINVLSRENNPNKTHDIIKHSKAKYRIRIGFIDGKVENWYKLTTS